MTRPVFARGIGTSPMGPAGRDGTDGTDGLNGLPGVNAVANDTATASYIASPTSATATALSASIGAGLNRRAGLTLKTDAERLAYTPVSGESVYATDTKRFYIGDGLTLGGNADALGFSTEQLIDLGILKPRQTRWLSMVQTARANGNDLGMIPKPFRVGDSITNGDGSTGGGANGWAGVLGKLIEAWVGAPLNYYGGRQGAVSGSMSGTAIGFMSELLDPVTLAPKRALNWGVISPSLLPPSLVTYSMGRNDVGGYSRAGSRVDDYVMHTRLALQQISRHNSDPVFITEQPEIIGGTGELVDTDAKWGKFYTGALQVAGEESATVVDVWAFFMLLRSFGVPMLDFITDDGVHPNDAGHALYANLIFRCITYPAGGTSSPFRNRWMTDGRSHAYTNLKATAGSTVVIGTGTTTPISQTTTRMMHLGETGSTATVYKIAAGGSLTFTTPGVVRGFFVSYFGDVDSTGRPSLSMNGTAPTGPVTSGMRWDGYVDDGSIRVISPSPGRQNDYYYSTQGQPSGTILGRPGSITITANDAPVCVLGVTFITAGTQVHQVWADRTGTSGTDTTFVNGDASRTISGEGATETITFYGTSLTADFEKGPTGARLKWSIDGGAFGGEPIIGDYLDLWAVSAGTRVTQRLAYGLPVGWHTITLKADSKVSFGSGYDVEYGRVAVERGTPDPSIDYVPLGVGEVYQLGESWKYATIERVISGTPSVMFNPNDATLRLTSGSAVVRLER